MNVKIDKYYFIVVYYLGVEKKEDESEIKIFEIFVGSKMKFLVKSLKGLFVLDFVIDYLNRKLVMCMVKIKYREKFGLNFIIFVRCKENINLKDDEIKCIL